MPPDPSRVERPSGLRQIYPPVTFKYPLAQKLIETPVHLLALLRVFLQTEMTDFPTLSYSSTSDFSTLSYT